MIFIFSLGNMVYIWLALIVVFIIIEVLTFNLTTVWFAFGSLVGMICAYITLSLTVQIFLFLLSSIILAVFARPFTVKKLKLGKIKTNIDSIIGGTGVVLKTISEFSVGIVKVDGKEWSAKSVSEETIEEGKIIKVIEIRGVTLIVEKYEPKTAE
jgi:membrane protein implicated in regulation of membrane protease activity